MENQIVNKPKFYCSLAVIGFKEKIKEIWGLEEWKGWDDSIQDVLFFGLYNDQDYEAFWYHSGKKTVFWCGSDILRATEDPEKQRKLRLFPETEHYCETEVEAENLHKLGIKPKIIPSFLEDIDRFPISFNPTDKPHIWMCSHPNRDDEYGITEAREIAKEFPEFTFHIYGVDAPKDEEIIPNVIYHGLVKNEQLNEEIRQYQCGFRPNKHDGVSEVVIKSLLLGQYPIAWLPYEGVWQYKDGVELVKLFKKLKEQKQPNIKGMRIWRKKINHFPWVEVSTLYR
jgi:hypothetical protein